MSAVSGLSSKGEKSKQKYQSLNINSLYKGKSLETQKTSVAPKHGLQTLGKVGAGRRMPPPANLPSLKSQTNQNPNITLVPTGGQGWGSGKEEDSGATLPSQTSSSVPDITQTICQKAIQSNPSVMSSIGSIDSSVGAIAVGLTSAALTAASKTWSTITASAEHPESGRDKTCLAQQSPFFPQEFPKLDGGNVPQDVTIKAGVDSSYGPGPSLRPQTEGSWGRGTLPQPQPGFTQNANQPPSAGNGVLGQPASPPLLNDQNIQQIARGLYPQQKAPIPGTVPIISAANQTGPLMPGQTPMNYPNQYRMITPFPPHMAYPRGAYPGGAFPPQGFVPPHGPINIRQPYFADGRVGQRIEDENSGRPSRPAPPIITDKDLKGFDDILENDVQKGWAAADHEIDYNAKIVFSDDEDSHPQKESSVSDDLRPKTDDRKLKDQERRDYDRDERHKYRQTQQQWQTQQHMPANARPNNYDHSQQQHMSQTTPFQRQQIHSHSRYNRSEPMVADDDEMWRQRSKEQEDEMAAAVIRARQRREEEEKKMERSRQAAHEKLKLLEAKSYDKERVDKDFDQCSRHSSESKDDKQSNRDSRESRPFTIVPFATAKQYPKNVPPRFQKQQEMMRQTHQQSTGPSVHSYDQRYSHSNRLPSDADLRNVANNSQPPNKAPQIVDTSRSNSQISSGHESIDSERERRTPEYDLRERRHRSSHSGSESNNWRAVQTQRPPIDTKESDLSNTRLSQDKEIKNSILQREVPKKVEENAVLVQKNVSDLKDNKLKDNENKESSHSDKRSTSSKEDRYSRRYEQYTDWAAECDVEDLSPLGFGPKRDTNRQHRLVPITQKQFDSFNDHKKNAFVSLPIKTNVSNISPSNENLKNSFVDKSKELSRKSETPELKKQTDSNSDIISKDTKPIVLDVPKVQSLKDEIRVEVIPKKDTEREKEFIKKDSIKDDKNSRRNQSNRYDTYPSRGQSSAPFGSRSRGREYRRSRESNDKFLYNEPKLTSISGNLRNRTNKSRRKSNSDDSCVSEDIHKKDSTKSEIEKSVSKSTSDSKTYKSEEERHKDRSLPSDIVMSSAATAVNQRPEVSRRGRGMAFRNTSTRGLPRVYGSSNYGPPPFRAAFGDGLSYKLEDNRSLDQNRNEKNNENKNSNQRQSSKSHPKDEINVTSNSSQTNQNHDNNRNSISNARKTSLSSNRSATNANNSTNPRDRSEPLPPRFQKRNTRGSQPRGPRNRSSNDRSGSGSANQLESDVANNEEWETASESSDVIDRSDRKSNRNYSSEQRSDRNQSRKYDNRRDYSRGQHSNSGNQSGYRGGRRNQGNNVSTSRSSNSNQRNGPIGSNINDNITVCSLSDVTLDNPNAVEQALSDLKNRNKTCSDLIEDQLNSETEEGFQTVSYKKRNRLNLGNDTKKFKQELSPKSKTVRSRQSKLAPRFAKQKETNRLNTISDEAFNSMTKVTEEMKSLNIESKTNETIVKTVSKDKLDLTAHIKAVPNAWSKPLSHCSQTSASNTTITTITKSSTNTTSSTSHDIQALSVSSKSSSFDQHDSGIDVSDQPPSTASSQRSSPSNDDNKLLTTTAKVTATDPRTDTRTDTVTDMDSAKPMCTVIFENTRFKEENKVLAKIGPAKSPSGVKDVFVNNPSVTNNVVTETSRTTQPITAPKNNQSIPIEEYPISDKNSSNVAKVVGMQRTNTLPTESDLNMKIASTKKVWESPSMTSTIDTTNENSKSVLLKTFEENKIISNESHTNDTIRLTTTTEPEQTSAKVHSYSSVDSINSLNKTKSQPMTYSTHIPNQLSTHSYASSRQSQPSLISSQQQILLNTISSPPLSDTLRPLSGVQQQFPVHNMATTPTISTPPTLLYNTTQVAAHNVYQTFGPQMDGLHQTQLPTVMAQFAPQHSSGHYSQHQHLLHQQHQQNQLSQNLFMAQQLAQPSATEQFKQLNAVAHQQNLAKSLLNNQYVHQNNSTLQQTMATPGGWAAQTAHTQTNNQTAGYYPQSSSVNSALQPQHFPFQSHSSLGLLSAHSSQAAAAFVQQSYRANQQSMGRTSGVGVDASNPMAANFRNMFAGNFINDMKIATSLNQTMDTRNANNRTSFTYTQSSNLQQIHQQQQQLLANQKLNQRTILPVYAQQMLGQGVPGRPNSASNVNASNTYTTPIQRPKLNRSNQSYVRPVHHQMQHQSHQPIHQPQPQPQLQPNLTPTQSQLSSAQQAKMRQEAVRQTQSFFAQSSLITKNESQIESQSCVEVSNESLTKDCVTSDDNKITSIDKNE